VTAKGESVGNIADLVSINMFPLQHFLSKWHINQALLAYIVGVCLYAKANGCMST
jgi:hypothetical protein